MFFADPSMAASEHGFEGRKPAFFKVLIGEYRKKLRIPTNFYKHLEGKVLLRKSILRCADGRSWHVRVKKVGDSWFFWKGWSDFVDMNGLQTSEFVVFRYDGISNFDIIMYEKNGCEKKNGVNGCKKKRLKQKSSTMLEEQEEGEGHCVRSARFCRCHYKMRSHLRQIKTENEDKWVFEADSCCPLQLSNPHFATRFRPCHTRQMPIALHFGIQTGLSGHKVSLQTVLLDPSGKPWPVNTAKKGNGRVCFGFGWSNFAAGNEVVPGDICVFELTKCRGRSARTHNVFQVHIVPKDR